MVGRQSWWPIASAPSATGRHRSRGERENCGTRFLLRPRRQGRRLRRTRPPPVPRLTETTAAARREGATRADLIRAARGPNPPLTPPLGRGIFHCIFYGGG